MAMPAIGLISAMTILADPGKLKRVRSRTAAANYAGPVRGRESRTHLVLRRWVTRPARITHNAYVNRACADPRARHVQRAAETRPELIGPITTVSLAAAVPHRNLSATTMPYK